MTLDEALQKAKDTKQSVLASLGGITSSSTIKDLIVVSYLALVKQHHASVILLIENNLHSSAVALSRPLLEACYRCLWVQLVADNDECEKIKTPDYDWKQTWKLAKEVDGALCGGVFHSICQRNIGVLNDFTHGGLEQISRQINYSTHIVEPTFSDEELIVLLVSSNAQLAMTLLAFALNINDKKLIEFAQKLLLEE